MNYREALEASRENISDGGGSRLEHASQLALDFGVSVAQAYRDLTPVFGDPDYEDFPYRKDDGA